MALVTLVTRYAGMPRQLLRRPYLDMAGGEGKWWSHIQPPRSRALASLHSEPEPEIRTNTPVSRC